MSAHLTYARASVLSGLFCVCNVHPRTYLPDDSGRADTRDDGCQNESVTIVLSGLSRTVSNIIAKFLAKIEH